MSESMDASPSGFHIPIKQKLEIPETTLRKMLFCWHDLHSDTKEVPTMKNVKHFLQLSSKVYKGRSKFYCSLNLMGNEDRRIGAKFILYVKSGNYYVKFDKIFTDESGFFGMCNADEFFDPKKQFFVDGKFILEMKGILIFEAADIPKFGINSSALSDELWESDDKDFKIEVGNEGSVMVHKLVLATRSCSFEGMLKSGMEEAITNTLKITDFDLKTVVLASEFFYDRNIFESLNTSDAFELLRFADKYRIDDLQDKLELYLSYQLSPSTVCKLANGAIYANSTKLRELCTDFLLICSRITIPVESLDEMDKDFAFEVFCKTFSSL